MWLLPNHQNLVASISLATIAISDSFAIVAVELDHKYGIGFPYFLLGLAVLSLVAASISYCIVPNKRQHRSNIAVVAALAAAAAAVGQSGGTQADLEVPVAAAGAVHSDYMALAGGDGGVGAAAVSGSGDSMYGAGHHELGHVSQPQQGEDDSTDSGATGRRKRRGGCGRCCHATCGEEWGHIKLVWYTARVFPRVNALFLAFFVSIYLFALYPVQQLLYYLTALLGRPQAVRLVDLFAIVYAAGGAISALCLGTIVDKLGIRRTVFVSVLLYISLLVSLLVPSFAAQVVTISVLTLIFNFAGIIGLRFSMLYSPGENYGTFSGVLLGIMAIAELALSPLVDLVSAAAFPAGSVASFSSIYAFFGAACIALGIALLAFWSCHTPPQAGSVTIERVTRGREDRRRRRKLGGR